MFITTQRRSTMGGMFSVVFCPSVHREGDQVVHGQGMVGLGGESGGPWTIDTPSLLEYELLTHPFPIKG